MLCPETLQLIACPACLDKSNLRLENDRLICDNCDRVYPIEDGIPVLLIEKTIQE